MKAKTFAIWAVAFVVVVAVHAVLLFLHENPSSRGFCGDEHRYWRVASQLFVGSEPPSELLWPPLYPHFLALIFRLVGGPSLIAVQLVQTLVLVAAAVLVAAIARRLGACRGTVVGVALAMLGYPTLVGFAHFLWPELLHLLFFLAALWIVLSRPFVWRWMLPLGVILGLALLTKSLLTAFLPLLLLPIVAGGDTLARKAWRLALVIAAISVTVAPTVILNARQTGRAVIADSAPFNLWVGLGERSRRNFVDPVVVDAYRAYLQSASSEAERSAWVRQQLDQRLAARPWLEQLRAQLARQYFRLFDKDTFFTDQLPGGVLHDEVRGYRHPPTALGLSLRALSYVLYAAVLLAATVGFFCGSSARPGWWLIAAFLVYNLAIFLGLHVKTRYRVQMLPFLFLYAGLAIDTWRAGQLPCWWSWRGVAATFAAGLLLLFAFGGPFISRSLPG